MEKQNTSLYVCIHVLYLYSSHCFVCVSVVCAEEGSEEKINEEGTSTSNSLLGSLPVFASVRKYEAKGCLPPSIQCVYTRGKNIKE